MKMQNNSQSLLHIRCILPFSVPTQQPFPAVVGCDRSDDCYFCCYMTCNLTCTMTGKPAVNLEWYQDNGNANVNISGVVQTAYKNQSSGMYVSASSTTVTLHTGETVHYRCVPSGLSIVNSTKVASVLLSGPTDPLQVNDARYCKLDDNCTYGTLLDINPNLRTTLIAQSAGVHFSTPESTCQTVHRLDRYKANGPVIVTSVNTSDIDYSRKYLLLHRFQELEKANSSLIESCHDRSNCVIPTTNNEPIHLTCCVNSTSLAVEIDWKVKDFDQASILRVVSSKKCIIYSCLLCSAIDVKVPDNVIPNRANLECIVSLTESGFTHTSTVTIIGNGKINSIC